MKFDIEMDQVDLAVAVGYITGFFNSARATELDVPDSVHRLVRDLQRQFATKDTEPSDKEWGLTTTLLVQVPEFLSIMLLIQGMKNPNSDAYALLGNTIKDLEKFAPSTTEMQEITFNVPPKQLWGILHDSVFFMKSDMASNYILSIMKQIERP